MKATLIYAVLLSTIAFYSCNSPSAPLQAKVSTSKDQQDTLQKKLQQIILPFKATIGIALIHIENRDTVTVHNDHHYPMQSVYKFPLALAVLQQVDQGILSLDQKVHIVKDDLHPTWSPIKEKYPNGNVDLTVKELLQYTVSNSDNNACDLLFRLSGGPQKTQQYLQQKGIADISVQNTEAEMAQAWETQYANWSRPLAMAALLDLFYRKQLVSDSSTSLLLHMMTESANSAKRIKGMLPEGTTVAHKTGTSDTNEQGLTAAANDVGIINLPDGRHIALAVFVSDSREPAEVNEQIIARIASAVFEHYHHE